MNKYIIILWSFQVFSYVSFSQEKTIYPNFIGEGMSSVLDNKDWVILTQAEGDLNRDSLTDCVLILESRDSIPEKRCESCKMIKNKPRIILVLLEKEGTKKVNIQNNKFIARGDEGGMLPYLEPEISIQDNALTIYYQFTRGNQSYTFKFINDEFVIMHAISHHVTTASGDYESREVDFEKRCITLTYGHISQNDSLDNKKVIKLEVQPKSLSNFGEMYEWEIAEYVFL